MTAKELDERITHERVAGIVEPHPRVTLDQFIAQPGVSRERARCDSDRCVVPGVMAHGATL
jgi:hypothetical protein